MDDATLSQASTEYRNNYHDETLTLEALDDDQGEIVAECFVVLWAGGHITVETEKWVSDHFDLADYYSDADAGVQQILARNEEGRLVPISVGDSRPINQDQEYPFYFAHAPIMAGTRVTGYVTFTDH